MLVNRSLNLKATTANATRLRLDKTNLSHPASTFTAPSKHTIEVQTSTPSITTLSLHFRRHVHPSQRRTKGACSTQVTHSDALIDRSGKYHAESTAFRQAYQACLGGAENQCSGVRRMLRSLVTTAQRGGSRVDPWAESTTTLALRNP